VSRPVRECLVRRRPVRAIALVAAFVVAGAWVGPATATAQTGGGDLRIAAEQEPTCADWIGSCAGLAWGNWILGNQTLPQAQTVDTDGNYQPGAMLESAPVLSAGPPMTVTYRIRADANWSDGQPITSKDFEYTWRQIAQGKDVLDPSGYVDIDHVDTTDPKVAVVTFKQPYAAWRDLFGGFYFVLPSHLLEGKDRAKIMKDGYAFSGGPWKLEGGKKGWQKGKSITLVPNDAFWGTKPSISRVVFQFVPESSAELQAVKSGQVAAAYPLPTDGALDQLKATPSLTTTVSYGNEPQALWLNASAFPLDSLAVRQALAYATDRQAIVDQVLKPAVGEGKVLQSFVVPTFKQLFTPAFEQYTPDPGQVTALMTGDGWTKGSDGVWAKGVRRASFTVSTTTGNPSRALIERIWQSELKQAGFEVKIKNYSPDVLFGRLSKGQFAVAIYSLQGTTDPGWCSSFCSKNIPAAQNDFGGLNFTRTNDSVIDATWQALETELDPDVRAQTVKAGQVALAQNMASLPINQVPALFVYNHDRVGGRIEANTVMGPFFTLNEWVLK